ncbi:hypothetical protein [Kamptonema sp. UHCC 0994]|nr:hypothetical protein [Kamptonema sp. UHCC 0994]MDF0556210.1 hypothetical protein [Kamptonema sp. UHCC 0994]
MLFVKTYEAVNRTIGSEINTWGERVLMYGNAIAIVGENRIP